MKKAVIVAMVGAILMAQPVMADDLEILSHLIYGEAGNCSREMMEAVGSVVVNRMNDPRFPSTIEEVVFQSGQYACTWDGNYYLEPSEDAIDVAKMLLEEGSQIDESVVWQAEFVQGNGIFTTIDSPWGTTMYFCY